MIWEPPLLQDSIFNDVFHALKNSSGDHDFMLLTALNTIYRGGRTWETAGRNTIGFLHDYLKEAQNSPRVRVTLRKSVLSKNYAEIRSRCHYLHIFDERAGESFPSSIERIVKWIEDKHPDCSAERKLAMAHAMVAVYAQQGHAIQATINVAERTPELVDVFEQYRGDVLELHDFIDSRKLKLDDPVDVQILLEGAKSPSKAVSSGVL